MRNKHPNPYHFSPCKLPQSILLSRTKPKKLPGIRSAISLPTDQLWQTPVSASPSPNPLPPLHFLNHSPNQSLFSCIKFFSHAFSPTSFSHKVFPRHYLLLPFMLYGFSSRSCSLFLMMDLQIIVPLCYDEKEDFPLIFTNSFTQL
jgi:hypothetical protein